MALLCWNYFFEFHLIKSGGEISNLMLHCKMFFFFFLFLVTCFKGIITMDACPTIVFSWSDGGRRLLVGKRNLRKECYKLCFNNPDSVHFFLHLLLFQFIELTHWDVMKIIMSYDFKAALKGSLRMKFSHSNVSNCFSPIKNCVHSIQNPWGALR